MKGWIKILNTPPPSSLVKRGKEIKGNSAWETNRNKGGDKGCQGSLLIGVSARCDCAAPLLQSK